jgi:peptidoglycan hydrolase CwlO-like protein
MSPTNAAEATVADKGKVSSLTLAANHDGTFYDHKEPDELDLQLKRHRNDLQQIDSQIGKLEEAIDTDQKRIAEVRAALEDKFHARSRLIAVRSAMARFIQGLQAKDGR